MSSYLQEYIQYPTDYTYNSTNIINYNRSHKNECYVILLKCTVHIYLTISNFQTELNLTELVEVKNRSHGK